jgi:hypothetical protein
MMNFDDFENYQKGSSKDETYKGHYQDDLSRQCDVSCLTPLDKHDDDQSDFESASFLSVGGNEHELFNR